MNIAILTNTSDNIKELSAITLKNKQNYADKHGYKLICTDFDYQNYNNIILDDLKWRLNLLKNTDILMTMGADTMFMNWSIKIEDVLGDSNVVIAKEKMNWWPINDDVMIWKNTPKVIDLMQKIIDDFDIWMQYPWRIQAHLWNLMQENQEIADLITLVEPEVMNQHPSKWQLGNWIVHFLGMPVPDKIANAREFDKHWGDGNAVWKMKIEGTRPGVL